MAEDPMTEAPSADEQANDPDADGVGSAEPATTEAPAEVGSTAETSEPDEVGDFDDPSGPAQPVA